MRGAKEQAAVAEWEPASQQRRTRRGGGLGKMNRLSPWGRLDARLAPCSPQAGRGRRPSPPGVLLRGRGGQWFATLSDPGMEALLSEGESVRRFGGLHLSGPLPDETPCLNCHPLWEQPGLGQTLFRAIKVPLAALGSWLKTGTLVDTRLIDAPSAPKT